jgi:hypothetical protein
VVEKMEADMNISDIKKMTMVERLQAMELLWDSLLHEDNELDSPEWHKKLLAERKKRLKADELVPLSVVRKDLTR